MAQTTTYDVQHHAAHMGTGWGWSVALGIGLIVVGILALANLAAATMASVFFVGVMMMLGGLAQIIFAISMRGHWGQFWLWLLLGVVYLAAGFFTFRNPVLATPILTLLLAASLVVVSALRILGAFAWRPVFGWGWLLTAGILTLIVGVIIGTGWPVNTLWVLGLFLGIDLVATGVSYTVFGLFLRRLAHSA